MSETLIHQQLKTLYAGSACRQERAVDGYRIDALLQPNQLVEVQTANFSALRPKLLRLTKSRRVLLVHPICRTLRIVRVDPRTGRASAPRISPRRGRWTDVFQELVSIADLFPSSNLALELLLTEEEERRETGARRRAAGRMAERTLVRILERRTLRTADDFLAFVPPVLASPFSTRGLALGLDIPEWQARQAAYCLREMRLLMVVGKARNHLLYARTHEARPCSAAEIRRIELRELRRANWLAYRDRLNRYYGPASAEIFKMEDHLAELAELLRETDPRRAAHLLRRERQRLVRVQRRTQSGT
ncbi:MAG: hypothetical protein HYU36_16155 [Planctomycetes bacterium]|nr:hypothetical protein [Planctomycetota bacterium]